MRYVRIHADGSGRSEFEDVEVTGKPGITVDGVPPLLLSGPFPAGSITFVEQPADAPDWEPHVAPRRQFVIVLTGRAAVTVSGGERREFGPGDVLLFEDTTGEGHVSTPLTADLSFAMVPLLPGS
ncbi:cupin domain-containing protein [Kibdelosporangium philippinense]|uniref:Cupin domain-containing protein n=1 Tax=Kibdelosporangium philippinense TaxID=211113 RepID=A0ABS8ZK87_9PSEU|nr:cupin domain-containing protein [Kibdelosporangium philippinense]MCE7008150.1 cupin domain-containing protein [Kibdelosporangium philippinense]